MYCTNAVGDYKLKSFVVEKYWKILKNKSQAGLPVIWKWNRKAWLTVFLSDDLFGYHFIPKVERYCQSKQFPFKVILIIHNAPDHPSATLTKVYSSVKVNFLPPNTTAFFNWWIRESSKHSNELSDIGKQFSVLEAVRIIGYSF